MHTWNRLFSSPVQFLTLFALAGCGAGPASFELGNEGPTPVADADDPGEVDDPGEIDEPDVGEDEAKTDQDGDGYDWTEDCDDQDDRVHPGAIEVCDGIDNDCDGATDDSDDSLDPMTATSFWRDADGDGFGDSENLTTACVAPVGFVGRSDDCDDGAAEVHPEQDEICDGIDNDCDGAVDAEDGSALGLELVYPDGDGDGFGSISGQTLACSVEDGFTAVAGDCDDAAAGVHPDAAEVCDGIDNDCNGFSDDEDPGLADGGTYWGDGDGDGYGNPAVVMLACSQPMGSVSNSGDCDDSAASNFPGNPEVCDGVDNDCDGDIDDADASVDTATGRTFFEDADGDGAGRTDATVQACEAPMGFVGGGGDCDDDNAAIHARAVEICDGIDNNCNAAIDDDDPAVDLASGSMFYADLDDDGFGDAASVIEACEEPAGFVANASDCDDSSDAVRPGAFEVCNGIDDDCDDETSERNTASFRDRSTGVYTDMTSAASGAMTLSSDGALDFCGGEWEVQLDVQGEVSINGYNGAVLSGGGAGSIITIETDGASANIDGITFADGVGSGAIGAGAGHTGSGGAISCEADARVEINNSAFVDNMADIGGAIASEGCDVDMLEVSFSGNSASTAEAIWIDGGTMRWAGGSLAGMGGESVVVGANATSYALLHAVSIDGADGDGVVVEANGDLVCSGGSATASGSASFRDMGEAVRVETGASFRSLGCSFDRTTVSVQPGAAAGELYTGETWMDCDDMGCGAVDPAGASGSVEVEGVVSVTDSAPYDCELFFDVSAVPTVSTCPDCAFSLEYTRTFDSDASEVGSCADQAVDSTVIFGFVPDYMGPGEGALMMYQDGSWTPTYSASIMGHYLIWSGLETNEAMGYSESGEPELGSFSTTGQVAVY